MVGIGLLKLDLFKTKREIIEELKLFGNRIFENRVLEACIKI